jgi:hypothetical protein
MRYGNTCAGSNGYAETQTSWGVSSGKNQFEIRSRLVTSKIVPMQFAEGFPVQVLAMDSLKDHL